MDKARLSTLAVLSTIFDQHEIKNVETEKLGFHISFQLQENNALDNLDKKDLYRILVMAFALASFLKFLIEATYKSLKRRLVKR